MKNLLFYMWSKAMKKIRLSAISDSIIHKSSKIESGCNIVSVKLDRYSFCGYNCEIINAEIGAFCSIANNVIIGGAMHPIEWASTSPVFYAGRDSVKKKFSRFNRPIDKQTIIGNDVWIGDGAFIKQGVTIGDGAIIGMGSVVTKDVAPYTIVAGNPAQFIRNRFDNNTTIAFIESKWWSWPDSVIQEHSKYIKDPLEFLKNVN